MRSIVLAFVLTLVLGTSDALRAEGGLDDPKTAKAVDGCQKTITKAARRLADARLKSFGACAEAVFTCVQTKPDSAGTRACATIDAAKKTCAKAVTRLAAEDQTLRSAIDKKCAALDFDAVVGTGEGAGLAATAPECLTYGIRVATLADYATCLLRQHACRADELVRLQLPRVDELLALVGYALGEASCPTRCVAGTTPTPAATVTQGTSQPTCAAPTPAATPTAPVCPPTAPPGPGGPCSDARFEPNDSFAAATELASGAVTALAVCAADADWYSATVPPGRLATLAVTFANATGDLDLTAYDGSGACLGGRVLEQCCWSDRSFETGEERLTVLNGGAAERSYAWRLEGRGGSENTYDLGLTLAPWADGRDCPPGFPFDECEGRPGGQLGLVQFPFSDPADGYVGDGYRFDSMANYRWARRELVMLVRYALHETQVRFPGTRPLGIFDAGQRDGSTPGYDVGNPRHPEGTHDQGGSIDLAYFSILAAYGFTDYSATRIVCDKNEGSNNGFFCNPGAAQTHVVDLPRQVFFMAKLFESPRVRVIGVDQVIAPLLRAEADRQLALGLIGQSARDLFYQKLGFGTGWEFHHFRVHVSLQFWMP